MSAQKHHFNTTIAEPCGQGLADWTQVEDAPVNKAAWAYYRQALREIPDQEGFPWDIIWPEKP